VAPGLVVTVLTIMLIDVDRADTSMFARIDWSHLVAMAVALGGLEYVLEEGPRRDWFGDPQIVIAAWLSVVAFGLFIERSIYSKNPIVRVSPFRDRTFTFACVFNLVIGFGIYASTYLLPVFLGRVRGYNSLEIGTTVFVVGISQLVSTGVAAWSSNHVDRRIVIGIGLTGFAGSLWLTSHMASNWGFDELLLPQLARGLFVMLCIVPSVGMALSAFQGPELRSASGLFNLMRNLGGAIGIATVNTWLGDTTRTQVARFGEALGASGRSAQDFIAAGAERMAAFTPDPDHARLMAQAMMGKVIGREALTIAFDEVFRMMAWMFVVALVMVPFCRVPKDAAPVSPVESH
jgi:DHA2 family multidrug resistance protein